MEDLLFQRAALSDLESLRKYQVLNLKGQVYDPLEERIELTSPSCLIIRNAEVEAGYAILEDEDPKVITLLEFFLVPAHRKHARSVFDTLVRLFHCNAWFVNSQDSFALPLLLELGLSYELDGYLFSTEKIDSESTHAPNEIHLNLATTGDLDSTYELIMQDGFYTGNGRTGLAVRIKNGEIYLLRLQDQLIGVGFVPPLGRTSRYADIAMIIDGRHRRQGFAVQLVKQLLQISLNKGLVPTALTSPQNIASRRTLERCGFFIDGCMLLAKIT
jgi:GNAT superfamily N-acetyltransferase